ncbi:MAG: hypothetical protein K0R46_1835 [Herbinix sp.]|jgi:hypothetical protein|nr:hypothetical protein [Herbinix sp.]
MSKMLKRIAVLVFLVTLVSAPSTALAASQAVCVADYGYYKSFEYQPSPLEIRPGFSANLSNNIFDGLFVTAENTRLHVACNTSFNGQLRYRIYRTTPTFSLVVEGIADNGSFYAETPVFAQSGTYIIEVTNIGVPFMYIENYSVWYD